MIKITPLKYAISNPGLTKGRARTPEARNSYIRDMWTLSPYDISMADCKGYWNISMSIASHTDSLTATGAELSSIDLNDLFSICRRYLPKTTELEFIDALEAFNNEGIVVKYDVDTLVELVSQLEADDSIRTITPLVAQEQRYLVQLISDMLRVIADRITSFKTSMACHGLYPSSDESGSYIQTASGPIYY